MRYTIRAVDVLMNERVITITNLAMLSRLNHKRCRILVDQLEHVGYIETRKDGNKMYVHLTDLGKEYGWKLMNLNRKKISLYT